MRTAVVALALGLSCSRTGGERAREQLESPRATDPVSAAEGKVAALERRAGQLGNQWADAEQGLDRAASDLHQATDSYERVRATLDASSEQFKRAEAEFRAAERRWEFYQALVAVAAALDAHNLDQFRAATGSRYVSDVSCNAGMSTAEFRAVLVAQGLNLAGLDVDHIVPRSLGGADHPANYQLLAASENRALGDTWDREKCLAAGKQCAGAVAVSRKCGSFRGALF